MQFYLCKLEVNMQQILGVVFRNFKGSKGIQSLLPDEAGWNCLLDMKKQLQNATILKPPLKKRIIS